MARTFVAALLVVMGGATPALAEDEEPLQPDRPGFADATGTLPPGHIETEIGLELDFGDDASLTTPSLLVRAGLLPGFEVRVTAPDLVVVFGDDTKVGAGDASLGLKVAHTWGEDFAASVVAAMTFPTGTPDQTSGSFDVRAGLNLGYQLSDALAVGGALAISRMTLPPDASGRVVRSFALGGALSVGYGFTEAFGAFAEAIVELEEGGDPQPSLSAGVTYLVTPRVQLDLSGAVGLTKDGAPPFVSTGLVVLW